MIKKNQIDVEYCQKLNMAIDSYLLKMGKRISDRRLNDCYVLKAIIDSKEYECERLNNSHELSNCILAYLNSIEIGYFSHMFNRWFAVTAGNVSILRSLLLKVIIKEEPGALLRELSDAKAALALLDGEKIIAENRELRFVNGDLQRQIRDITSYFAYASEKIVKLEDKNELLQNRLFQVTQGEAGQQRKYRQENEQLNKTIDALTVDIHKLETAIARLQKTISNQQKTIDYQQEIIADYESGHALRY